MKIDFHFEATLYLCRAFLQENNQLRYRQKVFADNLGYELLFTFCKQLLTLLVLKNDLDEASNIMRSMEIVTEKILLKKESIKSILADAGSTRKKIEDLHEKLKKLEAQCAEETDSLSSLEDDYGRCRNQLVLAEKTIKTLEQSQDRVKLIVEDLLPALHLNP